MKLTLKTLKQVVYHLELTDDSVSIENVKKMIEEEHKFDSKGIKLLFNGVILNDSSLLKDYKINDNSTIIMMTSKVITKNTDKKDFIKEEKKEEEHLKNLPSKEVKNKINKLPDYSDQTNQLKEMGFRLEEVKAAIHASQGSIPIAIEYLYNGIPPNLNQGIENLDDFNDDDNNGNLQIVEDEDGEEMEVFNPEILENVNLQDPNALKNIVSVIKVLIKNDTSSIPMLLEDVSEINPEIIDFIRERESEFKELMSKPITEEDNKFFRTLVNIQHPGENDQENNVEIDNQLEQLLNNQLSNYQEDINIDDVELNDEDLININKLVELGFDEKDAKYAYITCDKNVVDAENLLYQEKYGNE